MDSQALQSTLAGGRSPASTSRTATFDQNYELLNEIGKGAYGTVWKCCRRGDSLKMPYGVKIINKRKAGARGLKGVMGEVETMSLLNHPNIVRLEETFQDEENLWIIMEYMPGGELQCALRRDGSFSEAQTRRVTTQILLALEFIHQKGIAHRDMKPENCLLSEGDLMCKISDFGFAALVGSDQCLMSFCGTTAFMAPEIFGDTNYGKPVDMWAIGVMVYLMFTGEYPFTGKTTRDAAAAICDARYNLKKGKIAEGSHALRDFISKLLVVDPNRRLSARDALKHPWIKLGMSMEANSTEDPPEAANDKQKRKKRGLRPRAHFRCAVIAVMAVHRLRYLRRCRVLEEGGCGGCGLLHNFHFAVSGAFEPPQTTLDCSGLFARNLRGVAFLVPMIEASRTIETLDLSNNNIDNLSVFQQLLRAVGQHPSLSSLNLSGNPIPAIAGRGIQRVVRSPHSRLLHVGLDGTLIPSETLAQITAALKEKAAATPAVTPASHLSSTARSGNPTDMSSSSLGKARRLSLTSQPHKHGSPLVSLPRIRVTQSSSTRLPLINPTKRRTER